MVVKSDARGYAKVLYELCAEQNKIDEVLYQSVELIRIHRESMTTFLDVPIISNKDKKEIVRELKNEGYDILIINLLLVLIDSKKVYLFESIINDFKNIYSKQMDIKVVKATFAKQPSKENIDLIRMDLEAQFNKFVAILVEIDPTVIGGVRLSIDGYVVDNTILAKLERLSKIAV